MTPVSKFNQSFLSEADLRGGPESPTTPGTYWFQSETMSRAVMVDVRLMDGELMVCWLTREDEPVANLKGRWRGRGASLDETGPCTFFFMHSPSIRDSGPLCFPSRGKAWAWTYILSI
jgi:hypothetical protein